MANRVLRDWTDSEKINKVSVNAERFFTRLIMKVDDFGCYTCNLKLIKSSLFPLLIDEVREADISRWMAECQKAGLILFYKVNDKQYLQIQDFKQRLRQAKNKYPLPLDGQLTVNGPLETKRNEEETNATITRFDPSDYYKTGAEGFEDVKNNEILMEDLTRIFHNNGFRACTQLTVILAVKKFFTIEGAKEEFKTKPKKEVKSHLVNWINKNANRLSNG